MKRLIPLFVLMVASLGAEEVVVKQPALLRQDRSAVSIKPGTSVELVSRDGENVVIKYRGLTGKILASKLEESKAPATPPPAAAAATTPAPAPVAKAPEGKKTEKAPEPAAPGPKLAENPQTSYGKMVKKAKDTVQAHDKNLVKPTNEVTKETP